QLITDNSDIHTLPGISIGHRVFHRGNLNMIIPIDLRFAPHHRLPPLSWQRQQCMMLMLLKQISAAEFLVATKRGARIDDFYSLADRGVEPIQAGESSIR